MGEVFTEGLFDDISVALEGLVQGFHHRGCGALLGAVNGGGALGAAEGIGDIRSDGDASLSQNWMKIRHVDGVQGSEREAAGRQLIALLVEEPDAEGGGHAGAAVVGGGAADADDEASIALIQGFFD